MPAFDVARDEMLARFKVQWDADSPAFNGGQVPRVFWEGVGELTDRPHDAPWATVTVRHGPSSQASLASDSGLRRFERTGLVIVQVFTPLEKGLGIIQAENLAKVAKRAFEGKSTPSQVWFRDVTINEVGVDGPWMHLNVVAGFVYDEQV